MTDEAPVVCKALTKAGTPCRVLAMPGSEYCAIHQPPQAAAEAETRKHPLGAALGELVGRLRAGKPEYEPPPYSPKRLLDLLEELQSHLPAAVQGDAVQRLRDFVRKDMADAEFWKGTWYMLNYTLKYQADLLKRRYTGEYETDDWGLDWEFVDAMRPFLAVLYKAYWRVQASGLENVPSEGRAILVANRAGQLPWDSLMLTTAILTQHPSGRLVRGLYGSTSASMPFLAPMLVMLGGVPATLEDGLRLLMRDELLAVFPEGDAGAWKTFRERYRLGAFGNGDFVKMALRTAAPIIPVAVVGAEEAYVRLARLPAATRDPALPYVPITLTFPWLGLLGLVPLPTKWYLDFGEPIATSHYGESAAENQALISQLAGHVRNTLQEMLEARLARRRSVFRG